MNKYKANGMTPFVPAKDFELSIRFYEDIGFSKVTQIEGAIEFEVDGYGFWLQDYYVEDWANNFMMCLYVESMEDWWGQIRELEISKKYDEKAKVLSEPHKQEGGVMMQIADPSGVLWHIRENK